MKLISGLVNKVRHAERVTLRQMHAGSVAQEPAITDRLLGAMAMALDGETIGGVTWAAKTLTDRARGAEEKEFGADFLSVFKVEKPNLKIAKGFLAQAKFVEPGEVYSQAEFDALKDQCLKMLRHSVASYVFLYSHGAGIRVIPAVDVVATGRCNPHDLLSRTLGEFYKSHFECFVGDRMIQSADTKALSVLRDQLEARTWFYLAGTATGSSWKESD